MPSENEAGVVCVIFRTAYKLKTRELIRKCVAASMKINSVVGTEPIMEITGT
jgi:hypothetical protein